MNIRVHIDRIVLDGLGVPSSERRRVQSAIERELASLLRAGGISSEVRSASALDSVCSSPISVAPAAPATELGRDIAAAIYRGIGGGL